MLIYEGDFDTLSKRGYITNISGTYYFKSLNRSGAIFVDITTRLVTTEDVCDIRAINAELKSLEIRELKN